MVFVCIYEGGFAQSPNCGAESKLAVLVNPRSWNVPLLASETCEVFLQKRGEESEH